MIQIQELTTKILMASRPHCTDSNLLSFLSQLGELDDKGREQVLDTARVAYDNYIETQCPSAWDYGCYRD